MFVPLLGLCLFYATAQAAERIRISTPGDAAHFTKHLGLDPDKDVKFIPGGSGEARLIRMKQGLLHATIASVPNDYLGRKMGYPVIVRSEDLFTYPFSGLTVHVKKIKEKPDEIKRV